MASALPFHRFDLIDRDLNVLLRGATPDRLEAATSVELEPEVALEVRHMLRERRCGSSSSTMALVGIDYAIRISGPEDSEGRVLVALERLTISARLEALAIGHALDATERELLRLIAGDASESAIAWRLGRQPSAVAASVRELCSKLELANRESLKKALTTKSRLRRARGANGTEIATTA